jgi:hypothetical protein
MGLYALKQRGEIAIQISSFRRWKTTSSPTITIPRLLLWTQSLALGTFRRKLCCGVLHVRFYKNHKWPYVRCLNKGTACIRTYNCWVGQYKLERLGIQSAESFLVSAINDVAEEKYGELVSLARSKCSGRATLIDGLGYILLYERAKRDVGLHTSMLNNFMRHRPQ